MSTSQLNTLDNNIFTVIDKLKKQKKRADTDSIYGNIIKISDFQDLTKNMLQQKINDLIIEGKIMNKINRGKNSYAVNDEIIDTELETTVNMLHNFTLNTPIVSPSNSPVHPSKRITDSELSVKTISSKNDMENVRESEILKDSFCNELKIEQLKEEILIKAELNMTKRFEIEFSNFKLMCEKLVSKSYENFNTHRKNLEKQLENKDKLIAELIQTINSMTTLKSITTSKEPILTIPTDETFVDMDDTINDSNSSILVVESAKTIEDSTTDPVLQAINKYKTKLNQYRQNRSIPALSSKNTETDMKSVKPADSKKDDVVKPKVDNNKIKLDKSKSSKKKVFVLGDSMVKHVNGYQISSRMGNKVNVHVRSFSGAKVRCMEDYCKPCVRENDPDHIILHVGTNELNSEKSAEMCGKEIMDLAKSLITDKVSGTIKAQK